jgi:hypothetical protein
MITQERKINNRNIVVGIVLMCVCVYVGAISAIPAQAELVTSVINLPSHMTDQNVVSQESVSVALQDNVAVINAIPDISSAVKIIIVVGVALVIFSLLSMTGLVPRYGGMGD